MEEVNRNTLSNVIRMSLCHVCDDMVIGSYPSIAIFILFPTNSELLFRPIKLCQLCKILLFFVFHLKKTALACLEFFTVGMIWLGEIVSPKTRDPDSTIWGGHSLTWPIIDVLCKGAFNMMEARFPLKCLTYLWGCKHGWWWNSS